MSDQGKRSDTVPHKAMHEARVTIHRLKTLLALSDARAAGLEAERAQLQALLGNNHSFSCSACVSLRLNRGSNP
jgi:hypothetical protein